MVTLHFSQIFWLPYLAVWWDRTSGVDGGTLQFLPPLVSSQHGEGETLSIEWPSAYPRDGKNGQLSCHVWETSFTKRETAVDTQDTYWPGFGSSLRPGPGGLTGLRHMMNMGEGWRMWLPRPSHHPHSFCLLLLQPIPAFLTSFLERTQVSHSGVWCVAITGWWSSALISLCSLTSQGRQSKGFTQRPSPRSYAPKPKQKAVLWFFFFVCLFTPKDPEFLTAIWMTKHSASQPA